jgi:hypothetical protein
MSTELLFLHDSVMFGVTNYLDDSIWFGRWYCYAVAVKGPESRQSARSSWDSITILDANLDISPVNWTAPSGGGTSGYHLVTNSRNISRFNWHIGYSPGWLNLSRDNGSVPDSFIISATPNNSGFTRSENVMIVAMGVNGSPLYLNITQDSEIDPAIWVTNSVEEFYSAVTVIVSSNLYPIQYGETIKITVTSTISDLCLYECIDWGNGYECDNDCGYDVTVGRSYRVERDYNAPEWALILVEE